MPCPLDDAASRIDQDPLYRLDRVERHLRLADHAHAALVELRGDLAERAEILLFAQLVALRDHGVADLWNRELDIDHAGERSADLLADIIAQHDRAVGVVDERQRKRGDETVGELDRLGIARSPVEGDAAAELCNERCA